MRKLFTFASAVFLIILLSGCALDEEIPAVKDAGSDKVQITATLFPQYDFAKQIAGDRAEVSLLLPPGAESHSYEPAPSDIININASDLFIYTGENMEIWSQKIVDSIKNSDSKSMVLDVSEGIELNAHEDQGHMDHIIDPHIWTDPLYAKIMAEDIRDALCRIDPVNAEYYKDNAAEYIAELDALDAEFKTIISNGKRNVIIFGSRFALYHFTKRYGLEYHAAFDSCSSETEPSAKEVAKLIDKIHEENIPVIYYAEMEDPKTARAISSETGAKMLLFHSCHNLTKEEFESGATYLSLMRQNAENLKEGLK